MSLSDRIYGAFVIIVMLGMVVIGVISAYSERKRAKACIESGGEVVMYSRDTFVCRYPSEKEVP